MSALLPSILAAAEATHEATEGAGGLQPLINNFGIDFRLILAQTVNFILVAAVLWKFAYKPVLATMDERRKKIADGLQFAEESKAQLAEANKKQAQILKDAHTEAQDILEATRKRSEELENRLKNETTREIEEMRKRAEQANELERQRMLAEVRQEIARLVVLTSGKVLKQELTEEQRTRFNETAVREMGVN